MANKRWEPTALEQAFYQAAKNLLEVLDEKMHHLPQNENPLSPEFHEVLKDYTLMRHGLKSCVDEYEHKQKLENKIN